MEARIKAITNKKLYEQRTKKQQQQQQQQPPTSTLTHLPPSPPQFRPSLDESFRKKLSIQEQLLYDKCKALDLPFFLAPYIKLNKHSVAFIAPNRNELLALCHLIVENQHVIREYFSAMQEALQATQSVHWVWKLWCATLLFIINEIITTSHPKKKQDEVSEK